MGHLLNVPAGCSPESLIIIAKVEININASPVCVLKLKPLKTYLSEAMRQMSESKLSHRVKRCSILNIDVAIGAKYDVIRSITSCLVLLWEEYVNQVFLLCDRELTP